MNEISKYRYPDKTITYDKVVEYLEIAIPEFSKNKAMDDSDLPTVIYDDFAIWLKELLNARNTNGELIRRCCRLIQELVDHGNEEVQNLVVVSIFEVLLDDLDNVEDFRGYFQGNALQYLDRVRSGWTNNRDLPN